MQQAGDRDEPMLAPPVPPAEVAEREERKTPTIDAQPEDDAMMIDLPTATSGSAASASSDSSSSSASASSSSSALSTQSSSNSPTHAAAQHLAGGGGGVLLAFGCGMFGLLGTDDESNRPLPTVVEYFASKSISSLAIGTSHALAVTDDSVLYSWGTNDQGALGLGDKSSKPRPPSEVVALQTKNVIAGAAGYEHSLALTNSGEVFAFGAGEMAQLGLTMKNRPKGTPPDLTAHATPSLVRELAALTRIIAVAAGENHSLALSSSGRVYAVGDGSRGALGLDFPHSRPEDAGVRVPVFTEIISLLPIPISAIAAGAHHSVFVAAAGSVYTSGDGKHGRLGYPAAASHQWTPRRITDLEPAHIITASAGAQHTLFLSQDHRVYSTGSNAHGELGFDPADISHLDAPRVVALPPIIQVVAGSTHSLARDSSNRVWSFGSGENGELGWSATDFPKKSTKPGVVSLPTLFPHQHVVTIAAGSNTSYVVVAQTTLTTTLVRSTSNGVSCTPTTRVTPSAASRGLASPNSYQLPTTRAFTWNPAQANADVEMKDADRTAEQAKADATPAEPQFIVPPQPTPIALTSFSYAHFSTLLQRKDWPSLSNYLSYCFGSALVLNASFLPSAGVGGGSHIAHDCLEQVYSGVLKASLEYPRLQHTLASSLQKMLSAMVLLLKQSRVPPKDIAAYRCVFIALQSPHLLHAGAADSMMLTDIGTILTRLPREVAPSVQKLYAHIPSTLIRTRFIKTLISNCERRMAAPLQGQPAHMRQRHSSEEVQAMVSILDGLHTSVIRRQERKQLLAESARPSDVTEVPSPVVPASAWYLDVTRYMDPQTDLESFTSVPPTAAQVPPFSFLRYPYLLSPSSKVAYLRLEFALGMQSQVIGAALSGLNPQLEVKIRRSHLVDDVVKAIASHSVWELRRPLKVQFVGEAGEDQGGLTNEFFELAFQHLLEPQYQLWEVRREWKTLWFSSLPVDPSKASLYQIVGVLLGMCVYNGSSVALNFPSWLYSQLLGITPTLRDLKALDPTLARSLEELLRFEGDIENTFCLTFEISVPERSQQEIDAELVAVTAAQQTGASPYTALAAGDSQTATPSTDSSLVPSTASGVAPMLVDAGVSPSADSTSGALVSARPRRFRNVPLLPGGEDISVTQANKRQYVALYLEYLFTKSVHQALRPLVEGFQSIVGHAGQGDTATMSLFTAEDLELLVVGKKEMNFHELKRGTRYEGGYSAAHPTIEQFWSIVLTDLTPVEQRQLLVFATGTSRAPVGGLAEVRLLIQRAGPDSDNLPTSSTCFHALLLPQYATREKMKEKLKLALANAVGFGLR